MEECFGRRGDTAVTKVMDIGQWISYQEEMEDEPLQDNDTAADDEEPPIDISDLEKVKKACLELVDEAISRYGVLLEDVRKKEEHEFRIHRFSSCLPSAEVSDRLLRYQGALERQLNDSMKQLERLQDRRFSKSHANESE